MCSHFTHGTNDAFAQIFRLDFASAEAEMPTAGGSVMAPERFERLAWGAIGLDPHGLPVRPLDP